MMTHSQLCSLLDRTGDMLDFDRAVSLCQYVMACNSVPGDIVEFGCYVGNTAKLMTAISNKPVWVYDSFDGLPDQGELDKGCDMGRGCLKVSAEDLVANFKADNLPLPRITAKWFKDVTPDDLPQWIAFAHLDGDFYESIQRSLELVWPRLSVWGCVLVDDFKAQRFPGVEVAVNEFVAPRYDLRMMQTAGVGGAYACQAVLRKLFP